VTPPGQPLYDIAAVRALEARATAMDGMLGAILMARAGAAAWASLRRHWPAARRLCVVCGGGNNGGDGYVVAQLARAAGLAVRVVQVGAFAAHGDAVGARQALQAQRGGIEDLNALQSALAEADVVVDALFGIGLNRAPAGTAETAIRAINLAARPCLSLDVPSGLDADTGHAPGAVIRANVTVTFIAAKRGLVTGHARDFTGTLEVETLALSPSLTAGVTPAARLADWSAWRDCLPPRARSAHKGQAGHVLVVGGGAGMSGAARLAAEAALRCGAGLVSTAVAPAVAPALNLARPEIMVHGVATPAEIAPLLARATVVAVGPGLGQGPWARRLWAALRDARQPLIVDADALNLLAADPSRRDDWILTPHPGEAARLLGAAGTAAIANDRYAAAGLLRARYGGTVVLKGAGTIVLGTDGASVIAGGNPGMASGGMGDVLAGVIAALVAQGLAPPAAAAAGAALHAAAGDLAARDGERGLLALDLMTPLRRLVN
jgi:NAD(P)H-hydrate epimerase